MYGPGHDKDRSKLLMRWRVRSIREVRRSAPGDEPLAPPLPYTGTLGIAGFELAPAGGPPLSGVSMAAMSSFSDEDEATPEPDAGLGKRGQKGGPHSRDRKPINDSKSEPESDEFAQPSDPDGVPEDMATLVLDNPALGRGTALNPSEPQRPVNYAQDETSDAAVMLRVAAGDEASFNYLAGKYHRAMINFLFRMVHNQAVAEELAQEVFLRVYRSRESYRAEAKFTTWLYRIATNLAVNHARDTKHERSAQTVYLDAPDEESGTTPDVADDTPSVEQGMLRDERMAAIRAHVMALPERQRMAVLMHKYQGMDYRQIGDVLKLSESATKSLLFRAYQTLRDKLKDFV
jgi:RNA polymerase sigma-70 factor, ECF subfamily